MSFLEKAVEAARENLEKGYYQAGESAMRRKASLKNRLQHGFTIIAEIKPASPTDGPLFSGSPAELANQYKLGGAGALSVLCEPTIFHGSLENLAEAKKTGLPVLAKDFVISPRQLESYAAKGADAVLLIAEIFEKNLAEARLEEMIMKAHSLGLEVVLETRETEEFKKALATDADIIGINNRNLETLAVDVRHYEKIITGIRLEKPVIAESGFGTREQVQLAKANGISGVLIGTSLLKEGKPREKVGELL